MTRFFTRYLRLEQLSLFFVFAIMGCASNGDGFSSAGSFAAPTSTVAHYGKGIGIPEAYLNGGYIGSQGGWGSGGEQCCVSIPKGRSQPVMVTVRWRTLRSNVKESSWHEETVPVRFAENRIGVLAVHFLPGHKVEVWSSAEYAPNSTVYPGPAYMRDPVPEYVPLPNEKPNPTKK